MLERSRQHPVAGPWLVALLALLVTACAGTAGSPPASRAPATPSASAPGSDPGAAIDVADLLDDAGANDGQVVRVTGNFLADAGSAQLCDVLMESYPPQCGGGIRLTGEVPADTLAMLETTREPELTKMWWGYVTVTGTFRASGANGQPVIEMNEIGLVEG